MSEVEQIADGLRRWLVDALADPTDGIEGPAVAIEGLRRTSVGFSRENWIFDAAWMVDGERRTTALIARRDPVGSVLDTDRRVEGAILKALSGSAVPVPAIRWLDAEGRWLGRPAIIMDLAAGNCDYMALNGPRSLDRRLAIAARLCDRLADIHLFDWRGAGLGAVLADPGAGAATAAVDHWEAQLRRVQLEPEPELEIVLAWLRAHAPANTETTLVHGDFKPGNVLMQGDETAFVLDWETAHLGDPLEDLGWVTNPLRAGEQQIAGAWGRDEIARHWSQRTGRDADPDAIHWWSVLANLKQSLTVLTGTRSFVDGRFDRVLHTPVRIYSLLLDLIGA